MPVLGNLGIQNAATAAASFKDPVVMRKEKSKLILGLLTTAKILVKYHLQVDD